MKKTNLMYPNMDKNLKIMGEQIKLARLRRELSTSLICQRANISRSTLWQIENGASTVSIGAYASVLHAIGGLDKDLTLIAKDDETGRVFQDLKLKTKKRIK
jgi:transcriptional regulator with XRE-family HTH domain